MTKIGTVSSTDSVPSSTPRLTPDRFEDFFRAEWESVYRPLAATIGDADLARDATAEAMARAYQRWSKVRAYRGFEFSRACKRIPLAEYAETPTSAGVSAYLDCHANGSGMASLGSLVESLSLLRRSVPM